MFIKNKTENWQSFSVGGKNIFLAPEGDAKDTIAIGDEFADDPILTLLLGKDVLEKVSTEKAVERQEEIRAQKEAEEAQKEEVKVVHVNDTKENDIRLVRCAAIKANGQPCSYNVQVPFHEYDSDVPYFCSRHKKQDPADYEKIDGEWVKKVKQE